MVRNRTTPHFSMEELRTICAAAGEIRQETVLSAARSLYPDRKEALQALYCYCGRGRAFRSRDGGFAKPVCTVQSWPNELAVMEDGSLLEY